MSGTTWDACLYDQKHSYVFAYGEDVVSLLAPQPGERILDIGCGTGHLSRKIADAGAHVIGIDRSEEMIGVARSTYESSPNLEFFLADATDFSFPLPFDAVFSNAALHWVPAAESVVGCIARSLKPGGRFVAEFGGKDNVATIIAAIQQSVWDVAHQQVNHPWFFPSLADYASLLDAHGFSVRFATLFERPTKLDDGEQGLCHWVAMFGKGMIRHLSDEQQQQVVEQTTARLRDTLFRDGAWYADYCRLRVVAHREERLT